MDSERAHLAHFPSLFRNAILYLLKMADYWPN